MRRIPLKRRVRVVVLLGVLHSGDRRRASALPLPKKKRLGIAKFLADVHSSKSVNRKKPRKRQSTPKKQNRDESVRGSAKPSKAKPAQNRMLPTPLVERNMPLVAPVILEIFEFIAALRAIKFRASLSRPMASRRSSSSESSS